MVQALTLTSEQRGTVIIQEAEYQLTIQRQYLKVEDIHFYLRLHRKYSTLLAYSQFTEQHGLVEESQSIGLF